MRTLGKVEMTSVPMSGHDGPYDAPIRIAERVVSSDWIDFNGHMNAAFYGLTFQQEAEAFLERDVGFGASFAKTEGQGPFVLQVGIHYVGELVEGEPFYVTMRLIDHDAKRMHMFFEMISARSGKLCATAEYLNMNVDLAKRRGVEFPDWLKARLAQMQADHDVLEKPTQLGAAIGIRRR